MEDSILPKHGGYQKLKSYQMAELVFDITVRFCNRYISIRSRTHDQMVQAARSGYQNIAEGSQVSGTSKKLELKLTGVARASLEELKQDYNAFLRNKKYAVWEKQDPRRQDLIDRRYNKLDQIVKWVQEVHQKSNQGYQKRSDRVTQAEIIANGALGLINVTNYLLDRQLSALDKKFKTEGGITERLYRHRRKFRNDHPS